MGSRSSGGQFLASRRNSLANGAIRRTFAPMSRLLRRWIARPLLVALLAAASFSIPGDLGASLPASLDGAWTAPAPASLLAIPAPTPFLGVTPNPKPLPLPPFLRALDERRPPTYGLVVLSLRRGEGVQPPGRRRLRRTVHRPGQDPDA